LTSVKKRTKRKKRKTEASGRMRKRISLIRKNEVPRNKRKEKGASARKRGVTS